MPRRVALLSTLALLAFAPAAQAQDVIVQGTTDIKDSGLVDDVIVPGFHAASPQYTLTYVSVGTGAGLTNARAGQGDAVVTHAASVEAQFVADGYSAEPYGRAVFFGDYVIVGPPADPAGVLSGAAHDAVHAFELIAAAGASGDANFVSRGDASGTNVEEQQIWNRTTTVPNLCTAAAGRKQPSAPTGACPVSPADPSWYHRAGAGQAATVLVTEQCPFSGSGPNDCYEITDRGTFNNLVNSGTVTALQVVSESNSAGAPGGSTLLVNSFHAYAVNPAKFAPGTINSAGATAFLDYLTSPALQSRLATYPSAAQPAFIADAVPTATASALPGAVAAGTVVHVAGTLANPVPGTPALSGVNVTLRRRSGSLSFLSAVGTGTTDSTGAFSTSFAPTRTGTYELSTPQFQQIEIPGAPPFGDIQTAGTKILTAIAVRANVTIRLPTTAYRQVIVNGTALPGTDRAHATITVLARRPGSATFGPAGTAALDPTGAAFALPVELAPGDWQLEARYDDPGAVTSATSSIVDASVPGSAAVRIRTIAQRRGAIRVTGLLSPPPGDTSGRLTLRARRRGSSGRFRSIGHVRLATGNTNVVRGRLARHHTWQLELQYTNPGHIDAVTSRVRSLRVL